MNGKPTNFLKQQMMEESSEYLLNELIGKYGSTLSPYFQVPVQVPEPWPNAKTLNNSTEDVSWDTSWMTSIPTNT